MPFRSGFIAIIGRPNAGKSTLLNAILKEKVAPVSDKPQTTRKIIRGFKNLKDAQMVFIDTPGIHAGKGLLNEFMVSQALSTISGADVALYLVEGTRPVSEDDRFIIGGLKRAAPPVVLAVNKTDKVADKRELLPVIEAYSRIYPFKEIVPISAATGDGVDGLLETLSGYLPEGPRFFAGDEITDAPERVIAAEMIREKVFRFTHDEVPYSTAVLVERFKEKKGLVSISAVINVERETQKGIVIGSNGAMLKRIGTEARQDMERLLGVRVYLELFVRVEKDWTKNPKALKGFGY
ncbi:MAG: GTPase Era [Deltaproteobacteria bacterium]|nr:GTPase Era [Deltaproteobacteria bacterium]